MRSSLVRTRRVFSNVINVQQSYLHSAARDVASKNQRSIATFSPSKLAAGRNTSSWSNASSTLISYPFSSCNPNASFSSSSSSSSSSTSKRSLDHNSGAYKKHVKLNPNQRLILLGFGAIGQGVLPLLFRHIDMKPEQVMIIANEFSEKQLNHAGDYKTKVVKAKIVRDNVESIMKEYVKEGDFLLNVSVDVSSVALIDYCQKVGALYLDTCNEPWAGGYSDPNQPAAARSNYAFREQALTLRKKLKKNSPTALITHGANPGLVTHFVKQALVNIAKDTGTKVTPPTTQADWANLAEQLSVKTIHIAEKDTQASHQIKHDGEFVNTWSIEGYCEEGKQPAELGWGTHEKTFPEDGAEHKDGCKAAIYLNRPGANTLVRTWTPKCGVFHGMLITHTEAISIADYFTKKDKSGTVLYRPTVHFAYHPCVDAVISMKEVAYKEWIRHDIERVMMDEIVSGRDELGVLLMGHKKNAYWYGSDLTIEKARQAAPNNNATSLQVCSGVLSGVVWVLEHPREGLVEPEEMNDHARVIEVAKPYLGELNGWYNENWTPLERRNILFPEPHLDQKDPWQFANFRVY